METVFGFILLGPSTVNNVSGKKSPKCMFVDTKVRDPDSLESLVERFWSLESIGIIESKSVWTHAEKETFENFEKSICFENGRYTVKLPFKGDAPPLENNYGVARQLLFKIERRLEGNPDLKEDYRKAMNDYVDQGFARPAMPHEVEHFKMGSQYFVPHHPVVRQDKVTTKVRPVFNASSTDRNGNSLNACLHTGPTLQPDLTQVLIRFRVNKIAIMADVQKMFCQTLIHPSDYPFQQYLWRDLDKSIDPITYIMTSVMFGVGPAPFLAIGSTKHHANREDMRQAYPLACESVVENTYVDDVCDGKDTIEEAISLARELKMLFAAGGWNLTKFVTNSQCVLETIPEEDRLIKDVIELVDRDHDGSTKALGIGWNVLTDVFRFQTSERMIEPLTKYTKRTILSKVAQIFDVFGFYASFVIRGKIIVQEFWSLTSGWDEELNGDIVQRFQSWEKNLRAS